jgi:transposase
MEGKAMMGIDGDKQNQLMYINLDDLVPQDHLLRDIRQKVDFTFIYEKVRHLYSPMGRKSIDPVLLIKMLLIGYLYGILSERKLEQDIIVNLAY